MSMISEQVKRLRKLANQWKHNDVAGCNLIFEAADTIEALSAKVRNADRPTGKWEIKAGTDEYGLKRPKLVCSKCEKEPAAWDLTELFEFCPNCGAKMKGESHDA